MIFISPIRVNKNLDGVLISKSNGALFSKSQPGNYVSPVTTADNFKLGARPEIGSLLHIIRTPPISLMISAGHSCNSSSASPVVRKISRATLSRPRQFSVIARPPG